MLACEPLYHVKACSSTSEFLKLKRSKCPDVRKATTKAKDFYRKDYKRKNPGTVLPYQSCQDKKKRGADELRPHSWWWAGSLFMHILQSNDRFQTLALFNALKYTSRKAAGRGANFQYNVKQFLIIQKEKHKPEITEITQQYSNRPISDAGFLLLHVWYKEVCVFWYLV